MTKWDALVNDKGTYKERKRDPTPALQLNNKLLKETQSAMGPQ